MDLQCESNSVFGGFSQKLKSIIFPQRSQEQDYTEEANMSTDNNIKQEKDAETYRKVI